MKMKRKDILQIEQADDVLFVAPRQSIGSLMDLEMREEWLKLEEQIDANTIRFVVIDLTHLDYFGSAVLDWMISLWKQVKPRGGGLALCNVSNVGMEILKSANLHTLWTIAANRDEAIQQLRSSDASS